MSSSRIYLDNAATTTVRPEALEAMLPHLGACGYNPSSVHAEGRAARAALDEARERVARCLGATSKEIVFTGGGSEADNLAIIGAGRARGAEHAVTVATEHHAVLHAMQALHDLIGTRVTTLAVDGDGTIDVDAFEAALEPRTAIASVMYVNNETGAIAPIAALAAAARARGVLFHTDAVQAAAYLSCGVRELGVDLLSLAAHKFSGPKGVGVLYVREGTPVVPLLHGGSQEHALRAGTENVAGAVGLASALELACAERTESTRRVTSLRDRLEGALKARIANVRVNGAGAERAAHVANVSFAGAESEQLLIRLDLEGVAVSAGSACASGAVEPSHVIAALGLPPEWTRGVLRFSLGRMTTEREIDLAVEIVVEAVAAARGRSGTSPAFR